jgi:hypothetical protein
MASHTLNDEEYQGILIARKTAETRAAALEAELIRVKLEDPANRLAPLNALARAQLEVIRFAVANLTPETTRGWPTKALERIAALLPTMPDVTADDRDLATELLSFMRDCESYALVREKMRADKLAADAGAPKGDLDRPQVWPRDAIDGDHSEI